MTKSRTSSFILVSILLLSATYTNAQITTDKAVLQRASQMKAAQEADIHRLVISLAAKKGWPLTIKNKKGRLAYLRSVSNTGQPIYITTTDNIISAATIRTNTLWAGGSTGLNLSGGSGNMSGKLAVWDEGKVRSTHVEFTGRVTQADGAADLSDHSTHVAGTMIAAGVNPVAKGMSYAATLKAYDFTNDESEMMTAAQAGLLVSNHSYAVIAGWYYNGDQSRWEFWGKSTDTSDYKFGYYDDDARFWDSIAYYAPNYLIAKAAGNNRSENGPDVGQTYFRYNALNVMANAGARPANLSSNNGYNIIATYGCAKNVLTVGAIGPMPSGYSQPSDAVLTSFSSWGPTGDGRIKPDVVADGLNVLSSISTADNAYDVFSGTSMATPAAAGSSFLLQEYYSRLHAGAFMRAATLKGILIHTADEAGTTPGPDYQFGWGVINMQKAASVITSDTSAKRDQQIWQNQLINSTHDADSVTIIASGTTPVTATICWTDVPGIPVADATVNNTTNFHDVGIKLVNDLDLRITDLITGVTYQPWILNPSSPSAPATRGDNIRDNVEKVQIDSLIPGRSYKVRVSHKGSLKEGTPAGSQAYSLLISGGGGATYCTSGGNTLGGTSISNVTLSNLNNSTAACNTYIDYTDKAAARLPIGQNATISVSYMTCSGTSTANLAVYIDFDNDGTFSGSELVAQNATLLNSSTTPAVFTGTIAIPANVKTGASARMRIVVEDGAALAIPAACGTYPKGETQDYRVLFTTPSTDVGVAGLEAPSIASCASDSQIVTIRIRNYGTTPLNSVPVTTIVKDAGNNTVATLTATCKDTIPGKSDVVFTYNSTFAAAAGATYTFISQTSLSGDPNTGNDQNISTVTVGSGSSTTTGTATVCGANSSTVQLRANTTGIDLPLWYDSPTATNPIAAGSNTSTKVIPSNNTYYVGVNDLKTKLGPPNKLAYGNGAGAYFRLGGNYINISTGVPLTISSAKMYVAHNGQINLTLATLGSVSGTGFTYVPLYNTSIDVYATKLVPDTSRQINVSAGDNTDLGGLFNLNIPIPTPGNYIIIIDCSDSTSAFINVGSSGSVPYPVEIPGVISVNSNNLSDGSTDTATYRRFWFPFYDINVQLAGCPGTGRTPVVATTETAPVITINGNVLTSSFDDGNQWYRGDTVITGATGKTDTAIYSGNYRTIVNDIITGCALPSNTINFLSTGTNDVNRSPIGLKVSPNPNNGVFQLQFNMTTQENTSILLLNTLGQKVYQKDYPDFIGTFNSTIQAGNLSSGLYVLKIIHGNSTYIEKILVKK